MSLEARSPGPFLWTNPSTGAVEAVPRHTEISDVLAGKADERTSLSAKNQRHPGAFSVLLHEL